MNPPPAAVSAPAPTTVAPDLDRLCVDAIRVLAMDAVEAANSGHPGMPMAMAPVAYTLFARVMRHDPAVPDWPDRDRFVLSAGHASMLLYATLHLSGYDLPLDDLRRFRQWGSPTPGHPERGHVAGRGDDDRPARPGLRQRRRDGDGRALPARALRRRGVRPPRVRALQRRRPDGGRLLRGRLAGGPARARPARLRLRRQRDHDRRAHLAELLARGRRRPLPRPGLARGGGRGRRGPRRARGRVRRRPWRRRSGRPSFASGRRSPGRRPTPREPRARTAPRSARRRCGRPRRRWDGIPTRSFFVPEEVYEAFGAAADRGTLRRAPPGAGASRRGAPPTRGAPPSGIAPGPAPRVGPGGGAAGVRGREDRHPRRRRPGDEGVRPFVPTMVGGSADLAMAA